MTIGLRQVWAKTEPFQSIYTHSVLSGVVAQVLVEKMVAPGVLRKLSTALSCTAEEMEKLEGILIATTNLADNLDRAFERRFLFKIRFGRPSADIKRRIWLDKLPMLAEADAGFLAANFDFSGGEIDNIARKALMMEVLDGEVPSVDAIVKLCGEEKIGGARSRIGFGY